MAIIMIKNVLSGYFYKTKRQTCMFFKRKNQSIIRRSVHNRDKIGFLHNNIAGKTSRAKN